MGQAKKRGDFTTRVKQAMDKVAEAKAAELEAKREAVRKEQERIDAMSPEEREQHYKDIDDARRVQRSMQRLLVTALGMSYAGQSRNRP